MEKTIISMFSTLEHHYNTGFGAKSRKDGKGCPKMSADTPALLAARVLSKSGISALSQFQLLTHYTMKQGNNLV